MGFVGVRFFCFSSSPQDEAMRYCMLKRTTYWELLILKSAVYGNMSRDTRNKLKMIRRLDLGVQRRRCEEDLVLV